MQQNKDSEKKEAGTKTTESVKPARTAKQANEFEPNQPPVTPEKKNPEGDEREWQAPDVEPKYPTDVQAKASSQGEVNRHLSPDDETQEYSQFEDEDDDILENENPDLIVRH